MIWELTIAAVVGAIAGSALVAGGAGRVIKRKGVDKVWTDGSNRKNANMAIALHLGDLQQTNQTKTVTKKMAKNLRRSRRILKRGRLPLSEKMEVVKNCNTFGGQFPVISTREDFKWHRNSDNGKTKKLRKYTLLKQKRALADVLGKDKKFKALDKKVNAMKQKIDDEFKNQGFMAYVEKQSGEKYTHQLAKKYVDLLNRFYGLPTPERQGEDLNELKEYSSSKLFGKLVDLAISDPKQEIQDGRYARFRIDFIDEKLAPMAMISDRSGAFNVGRLAMLADVCEQYVENWKNPESKLFGTDFAIRIADCDGSMRKFDIRSFKKYITNLAMSSGTLNMLKYVEQNIDQIEGSAFAENLRYKLNTFAQVLDLGWQITDDNGAEGTKIFEDGKVVNLEARKYKHGRNAGQVIKNEDGTEVKVDPENPKRDVVFLENEEIIL